MCRLPIARSGGEEVTVPGVLLRPSYDLDLKLAELKINGYVIFEELFRSRPSIASARRSCR